MAYNTAIMEGGLDQCLRMHQNARSLRLYRPLKKHTTQWPIPFLVSPEPLSFSQSDLQQLHALGKALSTYYRHLAKLRGDNPFYLFLRPDILLTEDGWKICEVETSLFGFALSLFLQDQYQPGHMLGSSHLALRAFLEDWEARFGTQHGRFVYSDHTDRFVGQLRYLAKRLRAVGGEFRVEHISSALHRRQRTPTYRCFYLYEAAHDPAVAEFLQRQRTIAPSNTGFYESKYPLAVLPSSLVREDLSAAEYDLLRHCLLPTWVLSTDVPRNFPLPLTSWSELALLPKSERKFVIKRAGNHTDASWARSVVFLHKRSRQEVEHALRVAQLNPGEWIIQPFFGNTKREVVHLSRDGKQLETMKGRVRLTPYFRSTDGSLLTAKATLRRDTLFIHGASDSINLPIGPVLEKSAL